MLKAELQSTSVPFVFAQDKIANKKVEGRASKYKECWLKNYHFNLSFFCGYL